MPLCERCIKLHPEVLIEHGFAVRFSPAALFPCGQPELRECILQILTVRIERDARTCRHGCDRRQRRSQLHAVVRRLRRAAAPLLDIACCNRLNDGSPAARPARIAQAGAVRVDDVIRIKRPRCLCRSALLHGALTGRGSIVSPRKPGACLILCHKALVNSALKALHLRRAVCPRREDAVLSPALDRIIFLCHKYAL